MIARRQRPKPPVWLIGVVIACAGCGHPIQRKLEGRWLGDSVENFDDEWVASATGWVKGASLEFSGSSITVAIPAEEPRVGEYQVASVRQDRLKLSVMRPDGTLDQMELRLDDEQSMRWMLDDSRSVVLRRE